MNKTDLVKAVADLTGLTKKDADAACAAVFQVITDTLVDGEKVSLIGFGTFEVRDRAARIGLNPATKEKIQIAASKAPAFKAGKALKAMVNHK